MINLNLPNISNKEIKSSSEALKTGWVSAGKYVELFEKRFKEFVKIKYAICMVNGSSALQLALRIVDCNKDNEVIVPSISFIATANAVIYNNSTPIFLDTDEYLNLSVENFKEFLRFRTFKRKGFTYNKKTKKKIVAVVVVHVLGNSANLLEIKKLCKKNKIYLIEDAAESLGTYFLNKKDKKHTGTIGDIGCFSFNANKIITTGGGGMLVTNNKKFAEKAKFLKFQAKENTYYFDHTEIGYNFRLPNPNCAIGYEQLGRIKNFLKNKKNNYKIYKTFLDKKIKLLKPPIYSESNHWLTAIKLENKKNILDFAIKFLEKNKIEARPIWKLLYEQKRYKNYEKFRIKASKKNINNYLCIPSSSSMTFKDLKYVSNKLNVLAEKINKF
jgi:perosamine synthetase